MCKHLTEHLSLSNIYFILFSVSIIQAQVDTLWTKTFGGIGLDMGYSVQQTKDEGYIITGLTISFGTGFGDVWLIKTNAFGDTLWTKTFSDSGWDCGNSVQQTVDEGYIITGYTSSFGADNWDIWLIKTNADGDTLWTKTFGGSGQDCGNSVQQTKDEGYIITGYTSLASGVGGTDVWLIKTNASGDVLWTKTFVGSNFEEGRSVQQTIDEGYIITGYTSSFGAGNYDVWLIKTDASGDTLWTKTFGGIGNDLGYSVQQTKDEGYIITGLTISFGTGFGDIWLIKTNADGDTLWTKTFGGSDTDLGYSVRQTIDDGYIITGQTESFDGGIGDIWLIKTNADGDTLWTKTFGGSDTDLGYSVEQVMDEGYIIIGQTTSFGAGGWDVWLIKTTPDTITSKIEKFNRLINYTDFELEQNYPNPFNPKTIFKYYVPKSDQVTISIYNISSQLIESKTMNLNPGSYNYEFYGAKYSTGIYFYKVSTSSGFTAGRKMVLLK